MKKVYWKGWEVLGMIFLYLGYGTLGSSCVVMFSTSNNTTWAIFMVTSLLGIFTVLFGYYALDNFSNEGS